MKFRLIAVFACILFLARFAGGGECPTGTGPGTPPVALPDQAYITAVGVPVTIPVLSNDYSGSGTSVVIASISSVTAVGTAPSPAPGTVVQNADRTLRYTPSVLTDATFTYSIANPQQPGAPSTPASVFIHAPGSGVQILSNCTEDAWCAFTAIPPVPQGIRSYKWRWGDSSAGQPETGGNRMNHAYGAAGRYTATVTIDYFSGETRSGSITFDVQFGRKASFRLRVGGANGVGLGAVIDNVRLCVPDPPATTCNSSFPNGTRAFVNWSPNTGDCSWRDTSGGCGPQAFAPMAGDCQNISCTLNVQYGHAGTFNATLRFALAATTGIQRDYPLVITVSNDEPQPQFTVTRPNPNVRAYSFVGIAVDDGPWPLRAFEWDFGDGTTYTEPDPAPPPTLPVFEHPASHTYTALGNYTVALKVADGDGKSKLISQPLTVANADPVVRLVVDCKVTDCEFRGDGSFDDGDNITQWSWVFGDGGFASGTRVQRHYQPGCYPVTLTVDDADGGTSSSTTRVVVGPPLFPRGANVAVDAHVQSYQTSAGQWSTTNGNLNGIAEPGETLVIEPQWPMSSRAVTALSDTITLNGGAAPWNNAVRFFGNRADYVSTIDKADCWSGGECYAVEFTPQTEFGGSLAVRHHDFFVTELDASTFDPTPGSPFVIHMGNSFADVTPSHWAYPFVESVLHAGVDDGCALIPGDTSKQKFCADGVLTRGEATKWLLKARHGGAYTPPACTGSGPFTDVPCSHPMAAWIAQFLAEGLTSGTGGGFTPGGILSRAEAAIFTMRAKMGSAYVPPPCSVDYGDVPCGGGNGHFAAAWISDLKTRGGTNGCGPTVFCPGDPTDRAQFAAFIARIFDIRIDARQCPTSGFDVVPTHPIPDPIASITFSPNPVVGPAQVIGTITLGDPPAQTVSIPLSIESAGFATISPSVTVLGGQKVGMFTVAAGTVRDRISTYVTGTYLGFRKTAQLDLCTPPPAVSGPASRIINLGEQAILSVAASNGALSYQWYQGTPPGSPISQATANSYTATPQQTTSYFVKVTNACGTTTSAVATVTVCLPPKITKPPLPTTIASGNVALLRVEATGSAPLTYEWFEGAAGVTANLVGTNSTLITPKLTTSKTYWVRVTSSCNGPASVVSAPVLVTVVTQVTRGQVVTQVAESQTSITQKWAAPTQPGNFLVAVVSASISGVVPAGGLGAFTAPGGWLEGEKYEFDNVKTAIYYYPNNPGDRPAETFGFSNFREATLQLAEYAWIAPSAPRDKTALDGNHFPNAGIVSTGTTAPTTQANELVITSLATNDSSTFFSPTSSFTQWSQVGIGNSLNTAAFERIVNAIGAYGHNATVNNTASWVGLAATFKSGAPAPCTAPAITTHPASRNISTGSAVQLSVTASGTSPNYQWYEGGAGVVAAPVGTNSSSFTTPPLTTTKSYWVRVMNPCGAVNSSVATITVN